MEEKANKSWELLLPSEKMLYRPLVLVNIPHDG